MISRDKFGWLALAAVILAVPATASATSYNFDVLYSGGGIATLASGSDDPLTTPIVVGDDFTYVLSAVADGHWKKISAAPVFPFFAFPVFEGDTRTGDFTLTLRNDGATVFSYAETGANNSFGHLGTNSVTAPLGLVWDTYSLSYTLLNAAGTSTPTSLLPWPGEAPEIHSPSDISYSTGATVPEPASWALMLGGFGLVGGALRRRQAAVSFA